jgi:hypothetical protein
MKQNKTDPNQFFSKQDISLTEAIASAKPLPPWRKKLLKDLEGNKNSSTVYVEGVNDSERPVPTEKIVKVKKNPRRFLNIIVIPLYFIHWLVVLFQNLSDVVSDGIHEIILALENFISNAQTEPDRVPPSN